MTTIAYCGRYLVSDSMVNNGNIAVSTMNKIVRFEVDGFKHVMALAGHPSYINELIRKIVQHDKDDGITPIHLDGEYEAIVIDQGRELPDIYDNYSRYPSNEKFGKYAIGSGGELSRAAMEAGANAIEAVSIAIKLDLKSGGNLQIFDLEKWEFIEDEK